MSDPRRAIPSLEKLLASPDLQPLLAAEPRARVLTVLRAVQEEVRDHGEQRYDEAWYIAEASARLQQMRLASLKGVINATGVVLHTNLGRAPLSAAALAAISDAARGYSNLEYDLAAGARGSRYQHCTQLLTELTGAQSALVVNNNAAALVLALNTFAAQQSVLVSRGELVEIGGSFRIPDILQRSTARLREVGTTNRTHLADYQQAIDGDVAVLLKVHRSNFEMSGFVSEVDAAELAELARTHQLQFIHDLGSGLLEDLSDSGLQGEPTARAAVAAAPGGIVALSGDKLLGGPQAGILLGNAKQVARMRANPLCRALRVDKLTLAALEATLRAYADGTARDEIPTLRMLCMSADALQARARHFAHRLATAGLKTSVAAASSAVGGGAFPTAALPTHLVLLELAESAARADARLRSASIPVVARIFNDRIAVDLRTVAEAEEERLLAALLAVAGA
jgi:L-seryl-tRNA(Ser) seleniumtransferase